MKREGKKERQRKRGKVRKNEGRMGVRGLVRGSQLCILNLADVVLRDLPPHLRICK